MILSYKNGKEYDLEYDDKAHSYKVEGVKVPSVTRVVDGCFPKDLTHWALSIGQEEYDKVISEALEIGNDTHQWIEDYINYGHACTEPEDYISKSVNAFLDWTTEYNPEWVDAERKVYCDKYKYAGTVDAVAKINGRVCVIDFKTSKKIYKPYHLQVTAYAQAIKRMDGLRRWPLGIILRLDKETGKFEHKVFEPKHNFNTFKRCLELKQWSSLRIKNEEGLLGDDGRP
jgi:hypothetical protein